MFDPDSLTHQILKNCSISDSRYAGVFSVCGLALRLCDLYKWEKGLAPWVEKDAGEILDWIGAKEQMWENLTEKNFNDMKILGNPYDPFDTKGINSVLEPQGFFYGAGYVRSLKPSFFLAEIEDNREIDGYSIYILGRELARDLFTVPALSQNACILLRKESAKRYIWDKIFFMTKSGRSALGFALEKYGVNQKKSEDLRVNLEKISKAEMGTFLYHELGELRDTVFDRTLWQEIIAAFPHTPIEMFARSVKDLLADTNEFGTLRYIARENKTASLALYVAFFDGFAKTLFPELNQAFQEFANTADWKTVDRVISAGYHTSRYYAETMCGIFQTGKQMGDMKWTSVEIEKRLLAPLGIARPGKAVPGKGGSMEKG